MKITVKFDAEAYAEYEELKQAVKENKKTSSKPSYKQLLKSIDDCISKLKKNPHIGDLIPRKYIPKKTIQRYGTDKILRVELVGYWRLLYTLIGDDATIVAFVLEFMDHDIYNKRFDYRKK